MVHPEVRNSVQQKCVPHADRLRDLVENGKNSNNADVRQKDEWLLSSRENGRSRVEMALLVHRSSLSVGFDQALCSSASIDQNICGPAKKLVDKQRGKGNNGGIGRGVVNHSTQKGRLLVWLAVWYEDGVLLHMVVVTVMAGMAVLPGEKWRKKQTVKHEPDSSVGIQVA